MSIELWKCILTGCYNFTSKNEIHLNLISDSSWVHIDGQHERQNAQLCHVIYRCFVNNPHFWPAVTYDHYQLTGFLLITTQNWKTRNTWKLDEVFELHQNIQRYIVHSEFIQIKKLPLWGRREVHVRKIVLRHRYKLTLKNLQHSKPPNASSSP